MSRDLFPPELTRRWFDRTAEVIEASPVKFYLPSYVFHPWPYRLQHQAETGFRSFRSSSHLIIDSGFEEPDVENEDVWRDAIKYQADIVVPKDYPKRPLDATTESIESFITDHYDDSHGFEIYFPVQPPYDEHYPDVADLVDDYGFEANYMLGGLANAGTDRQIEGLLNFREAAGESPTVHGLGWSPTPAMVRFLKENPGLIQSMDNSTPGQKLSNQDGILDPEWNSYPVPHPQGDLTT